MMLERAGHHVTTAMGEDEVRGACEQHSFDVVVVGQTVVAPEKARILRLVRKLCRGVKVLELYQPHYGKMLAEADAWLEVPAAIPHDLVERVAELVDDGPKPRKRRHAG